MSSSITPSPITPAQYLSVRNVVDSFSTGIKGAYMSLRGSLLLWGELTATSDRFFLVVIRADGQFDISTGSSPMVLVKRHKLQNEDSIVCAHPPAVLLRDANVSQPQANSKVNR